MNQTRVVIENIRPILDGGRFFVKRVQGEEVVVSADILADGHDVLAARLCYRHQKDRKFTEVPFRHLSNDRWESRFTAERQGFYEWYIEAWVDYALNWQHGLERKVEDGQQVTSELLEGVAYLESTLKKAPAVEKKWLKSLIPFFSDPANYEEAVQAATSERLHDLFSAFPEKILARRSETYRVWTDREKAGFSTWYEFFPRSASEEPGKHGTFKDCERLLPRVAAMGFDTLYFPPVHPIGRINRKGKNNNTKAEEGDVGSPWGIGAEEGGHKSLHPQLGTEEDFKRLVQKARDLGIEIAMDFALQAAPDHPYVKKHPQWFKWRPDGTVQYAENPPKKYQDILPIYFETTDWKNLWKELLGIAMYWVEEFGIRVFRVDNPHTKPFEFWGWLIGEVQKKYPDVLFLSEAFTRPKIMQELAKQGFTQSYTYFTWRNTKHELTEYITELTQTDQKEYFRPNFWPNTPDINPYHLQTANEAIYLQRYFLAATLSANTGVYGPVFEYMVADAIPAKEEYLHSEKYEVRHWDWKKENKLTAFMTKINKARRDMPSLRQTNRIVLCDTDNDQLMAYYKFDKDKKNHTLMVVSLDPYHSKQGWVRLPSEHLGLHPGEQLRLHDLLTGSSYIWDKEWGYVELHPALPFHLFQLTR